MLEIVISQTYLNQNRFRNHFESHFACSYKLSEQDDKQCCSMPLLRTGVSVSFP